MTGRARKYSDLDLAVADTRPLTWLERASLIEDFSESDLPIRVDIVDLNTVPAPLKSTILSIGVAIQGPAATPTQE